MIAIASAFCIPIGRPVILVYAAGAKQTAPMHMPPQHATMFLALTPHWRGGDKPVCHQHGASWCVGTGSRGAASRERAVLTRRALPGVTVMDVPDRPAPRYLAHAAMVFVTATFSLWNVLGDVVLKRGIDPIVLATYRELGTALLLGLAVSCMRRRAAVPRPDNHQMWLFAACGWAGVYGLQLFYILGLQRTSADTAALFQPLTPVLVVVISAVLGIERLTLWPCGSAMARRGWQKLAGVALACGGCALIVGCKGGGGSGGDASGSGSGGGESTRLVGLGCLLVSDLGAATFIVSQKPLFAAYEPLVVIAASYALGAAAMAATAAVSVDTAASWRLSPLEAGVVAFVVVVCGALDYALLTWANARCAAPPPPPPLCTRVAAATVVT